MGPPETPASNQAAPRVSRKRKLGEQAPTPNVTQSFHRQRLDEAGNRDYYDPDQDIEQRRAVRRDYRDLSRELTGAKDLMPPSGSLATDLAPQILDQNFWLLARMASSRRSVAPTNCTPR